MECRAQGFNRFASLCHRIAGMYKYRTTGCYMSLGASGFVIGCTVL